MGCATKDVLLFCLPKAFAGHFGVIQGNALRSWRALGYRVLVLGDEEGVREAAEECGCEWAGGVGRNEFGTPLLDWAFGRARELAEKWGMEALCYLNSDIILTDDFARGWELCRGRWQRFLLVGRRWNWDLVERMEFRGERDWQEELRARVRREGALYNEWNIDYFGFGRELVRGMPGFAVGRPAWDNWMIYEARRKGYAVVDVTDAVMAIHQNHDYSHTAEGRAGGVMAVWKGEEAERNRKLAGAYWKLLSLEDATYRLGGNGQVEKLSPRTLWSRRMENWRREHPWLGRWMDWGLKSGAGKGKMGR
jgi:hypothetical protein